MDKKIQEQLSIMNHSIKEIMGIYRSAVSQTGISENEFWVWYTLITSDEAVRQQELVSMWSLSKQTIHSIVNRMVSKGQISLEVDIKNKQKKVIRLTEEGKKFGESIVRPVLKAERRSFAKVDEKDRLAAIHFLQTYIQIVQKEIGLKED
ncbi:MULTISPECIES: MarR family winged helix-turn-helix transcriptional regulator [Terrabacteria group]|uniref:MarR family winged helix-turn-helix transcriptional regulator n=1 Tax=Bacillati TaxID=1783272 RepID=UPI00193AAA33|nr:MULTISPECIES: MarR family transcriptional regulator [Terrabacteria group]MBW9212153.1 hypothetical protein [Trueperella sp. zg.1013]QRG86302.1 hypothetical protein JOS54_05420 [Bulleidia sp. zg-1006]